MANPVQVPIPAVEVNALIDIILQSYENQFGIKIDPATIGANFIPARVNTRVGFEIDTLIDNKTLKLRLYISNFTNLPNILPFLLEDRLNQGLGLGVQVFVSISDLSPDPFPTLSKTLYPIWYDFAGPNALELEDGSGFIEAEGGGFLYLETQP